MGNVALVTMLAAIAIIVVLMIAALMYKHFPNFSGFLMVAVLLFLMVGTSAYWLSGVLLLAIVWVIAWTWRKAFN